MYVMKILLILNISIMTEKEKQSNQSLGVLPIDEEMAQYEKDIKEDEDDLYTNVGNDEDENEDDDEDDGIRFITQEEYENDINLDILGSILGISFGEPKK